MFWAIGRIPVEERGFERKALLKKDDMSSLNSRGGGGFCLRRKGACSVIYTVMRTFGLGSDSYVMSCLFAPAGRWKNAACFYDDWHTVYGKQAKKSGCTKINLC